MTNKEKFLALVSGKEPETLNEIKERNRNRAMIEESQSIALKVLTRLDELKWTQKKLAELMHVSPQQVNKIVKGQENLTLATQRQLQDLLQIPILASFYENAFFKLGEMIETTIRQRYEKPQAKILNLLDYNQSIDCIPEMMQVKEAQVSYESFTQQA